MLLLCTYMHRPSSVIKLIWNAFGCQQGLSPAASKDIGQPNLEELTAGLPALHLGTAKAPNDAQHTLDAAPSVSTPLPSEASLATASTTSTISSGKLSGDAAKAIETVRNSLQCTGGSAKADEKSGS